MAAVNPLHYTFSLGGGGDSECPSRIMAPNKGNISHWHLTTQGPASGSDLADRGGPPKCSLFGVWGGCAYVVQFCYLGQDEVTQILQVCSWDQNEGCTPAIFAIQCFSSVLKKKPLVPLSQSWWVHWIGFQLDAWSEVCGYHRAEDIYTFCSTT